MSFIERVLVLKDEEDNKDHAIVTTDKVVRKEQAHSDREVAPKLVKSGKKYGRRSKPTNTQNTLTSQNTSPHMIISSDSEDDTKKLDIYDESSHRFCSLDGSGHHSKHSSPNSNQSVQRSASHTDILQKKGHSNGVFTSNGRRLKRCASLPPQRNRNREMIIETSKEMHRDDCIEEQGITQDEREAEIESFNKLTHNLDSRKYL